MKLKKFGPGYDSSNGEELYIGIDQSYSGFAITILDENGGYETTVAKFEGGGVNRLQEIYDHVNRTIYAAADQGNVVASAIEGYAFGSQMANMLGELGGIVKLALLNTYRLTEPNAKYPLIVPPTSLKKYVTGKGNGVPKSQMVLHVYKLWGAEFSDDNAADSYALAKLVSGDVKYAYQQDVIDKLNDPKFREKQSV